MFFRSLYHAIQVHCKHQSSSMSRSREMNEIESSFYRYLRFITQQLYKRIKFKILEIYRVIDCVHHSLRGVL